jgi:hypothetical protein
VIFQAGGESPPEFVLQLFGTTVDPFEELVGVDPVFVPNLER